MPEELKPCPDRMRFRKKVAAPPEPEELKLELLPCPVPWCKRVSPPWARSSRTPLGSWKFVVGCYCGLVTRYFDNQDDAVAAWNKRESSELERLAREWKSAWSTCGQSDAAENGERLVATELALAAYFAEPSQKGKQE